MSEEEGKGAHLILNWELLQPNTNALVKMLLYMCLGGLRLPLSWR